MACAATGEPPHEASMYRFRGASGRLRWPREDGIGLGACGIWNFLWRLGFHPADVSPDILPRPADGDVVFVQLDSRPSPAHIVAVRQWADAGGRVVGSGVAEAWQALRGDAAGAWQSARPQNPYAALAYLQRDAAPALVTPPRWTFGRRVSAAEADGDLGQLSTVGGERQTPCRAIVQAVPNAPALTVTGGYGYINGNPFAAFQSWLQGQDDLGPWMSWRPRLFWLDHWVSTTAELLNRAGMLALDRGRPGIRGLDATTVVLRHDVDYSRDTTYLDEEARRGVSATHTVLDDSNTSFWLQRLRREQSQEAAFHYATGVRDVPATARQYLNGERRGVWKAWKAGVVGRGLDRQVRRARSKGIPVATLHRHLPFIVYPEWIDALDAVFERHEDVLGSSSMFRAQLQRWGRDRVDAFGGAIGEWPDSQFPLWLPFKLAHAARGGRRLRGWETTSLMETEPELVAQMIQHPVPHLPQRVITLGFHPASAAKPTFAAGGSAGQCRDVLSLLAGRHVETRTLADVYRLASAAAATT